MPELSAAQFAYMARTYALQDLVFALPALLVFWALWRYWLRDLAAELRLPAQPGWRKGLLGLAFGAGLALLGLLPGLLGGAFSPRHAAYAPFAYLQGQGAAGIGAGGLAWLFTAQSLYEELIFRGFALGCFALLLLWQAGVLYRIGQASRAPAPLQWRARAWFWCGSCANLVVAIAFSSVHEHNPGITPLAGVNIALAGLLLGQLCWNGGALWGAWGTHLGWNLSLALLGLPVSGLALVPGPLGFGLGGAVPGLLTGGSFGPENSLPACLALLAAYFWQLHLAWRAVLTAANSATQAEPVKAEDDRPAPGATT